MFQLLIHLVDADRENHSLKRKSQSIDSGIKEMNKCSPPYWINPHRSLRRELKPILWDRRMTSTVDIWSNKTHGTFFRNSLWLMTCKLQKKVFLTKLKGHLNLSVTGEFLYSQYRNKEKNTEGTEDLFLYRRIFVKSVFVRTIFACTMKRKFAGNSFHLFTNWSKSASSSCLATRTVQRC